MTAARKRYSTRPTVVMSLSKRSSPHGLSCAAAIAWRSLALGFSSPVSAKPVRRSSTICPESEPSRCLLWGRKLQSRCTSPVDPFRQDAASVNDRFRLGAGGRVGASHCLRFPRPDIGRPGVTVNRDWPKARHRLATRLAVSSSTPGQVVFATRRVRFGQFECQRHLLLLSVRAAGIQVNLVGKCIQHAAP